MPRRRLSSDGLKLFNMAIRPPPSRIQELLYCIFHSPYDDQLEEMTKGCEKASRQLYAFHTDPIKKDMIRKYVDNSVFNIVYAVLCKDGEFTTKFHIKRNYRYFIDVMKNAFMNGDHNTAILLRQALNHHALKQLKLPLRKRDKILFEEMEMQYGSWRDSFMRHFKKTMNSTDFEIIPSMLVMQMHMQRFKQYSTIGRCKAEYAPGFIEGKIGMYGTHNILSVYDDAIPLYEEPPITSSSELILIAQSAK